MHRQVGDLKTDRRGLAVSGLLVRHLVMPGASDDAGEIMRFLASEISENTYVNIMDQYRPMAKVNGDRYSEINRGVTSVEMGEARAFARAAGLHRFDERRARVFI